MAVQKHENARVHPSCRNAGFGAGKGGCAPPLRNIAPLGGICAMKTVYYMIERAAGMNVAAAGKRNLQPRPSTDATSPVEECVVPPRTMRMRGNGDTSSVGSGARVDNPKTSGKRRMSNVEGRVSSVECQMSRVECRVSIKRQASGVRRQRLAIDQAMTPERMAAVAASSG